VPPAGLKTGAATAVDEPFPVESLLPEVLVLGPVEAELLESQDASMKHASEARYNGIFFMGISWYAEGSRRTARRVLDGRN
jgi:hypothetical protein